MWTTGIAPLCSHGFVIDNIMFYRVMPRFGLCCTVFVRELSSFSELVGVTDQKPSLLLLLSLPNGIAIYFFPFATRFLTFSCLFFFQFLCSDKDRFCSLAFFASHLITMFDVMFIFTSSAELQVSLSLLLSGCECCVAFQ